MGKIFKKSEKGQKEFEHGVRTLSLKYRQLLVMIDGQRSVGDLIELFNQEETAQILHDLENMGYVVDKNAIRQLFEKGAEQQDVLDTLSQQHVTFIKEFLVGELVTQTGAFLNRDLIERIKLVQDSANLKPCISRWHMAMREARCGKTVADHLMAQLEHMIANPPAVEASMLAS